MPREPVNPGSSLTLLCVSYGAQPDARLYWYRRGQLVDNSFTYSPVNREIENEYTFEVTSDPDTSVECRLTQPSTNSNLTTTDSYRLRGITPLSTYALSPFF